MNNDLDALLRGIPPNVNPSLSELYNIIAPGLPGPIPHALHHYTTSRGLAEILRTGVIRATSAFYLNDSSEIIHGLDRFRAVVDTGFGRSGNAHEHLIAAQFGNLDFLKSRDIHVFCLSEEENQLSQWRAYGGTGGF